MCVCVHSKCAWPLTLLYMCIEVYQIVIDNYGSGYLGMAGCFSVQGKKWSKLTNFQPTLSWFKTVSVSN